MSLWAELKRRNVVRVAIAYLAAVWLLVQAAAIILPAFEFPDRVMRAVLGLGAFGFVLTLVLAWIYDLTPDGIRRTDDLPAAEVGVGLRGRKLDFLIIGLLSLALIAVVFDRYFIEDTTESLDTFLNEATIELVSDFPGSHSEPALSPDGTMIAFVSDASGSSQIWVKDLAQGEPIQITTGELDSLSPSWSPQNDQILFQRQGGPTPSIFSVGPLGTPASRLLVERGLAPSFGAGGRRFVYAAGREVWIADADGGNRRRIEGIPDGGGFGPRSPALSPDGSLVAFLDGEFGPAGEIWVVPADGGEARRLTRHIDRLETAGSPSWTPDGRFILYTAGSFGSQHLWRVDVDTGESAPLTTGTGGYDAPSISGDGESFAYSNRRSLWKLMRTDTATGAHAEIHESRNPIILPRLSPDSAEIVFFTQVRTGLHLFAIGVDGEDLRQLTFDDGGVNTLPVWSDSGDWIYYHRSTSLHRIPAAGGPSVEVLPDFHWSSRNWLAVHGNRIAYHEFGIEPGVRRTIVRDLETGTETAFTAPGLSGIDWSGDGSMLLGHLPDLRLAICPIATRECDVVTGPDGPIRGERPQWSSDESRVFLLRRSPGRAFYRTLWVVDRDGQNLTNLFEFGPIDVEDYLAEIDGDDALVWNQRDRGSDEIWVARRPR
jgi:Tol biopolymer transport system component